MGKPHTPGETVSMRYDLFDDLRRKADAFDEIEAYCTKVESEGSPPKDSYDVADQRPLGFVSAIARIRKIIEAHPGAPE